MHVYTNNIVFEKYHNWVQILLTGILLFLLTIYLLCIVHTYSGTHLNSYLFRKATSHSPQLVEVYRLIHMSKAATYIPIEVK